MDWFRFYSEAINDKKLRRVARLSSQSFAEVLGVWSIVLSIASESPERGALLIGKDTPATDDDISELAGCNVSETLQKLRETGLVTERNGVLIVENWSKRQYESDNSTKRVHNWRERQKAAKTDQTEPESAQKQPQETKVKRYSNAAVTPTDTDTDTDSIPATQERPPVKTPARQPNETYQLAEALASVCMMDFEANKGRLLKEAAQLRKAKPPPTPDLLAQHYNGHGGWWYAKDWRGKNGEPPQPATIRETWGKWLKDARPAELPVEVYR